MIALGLTIYAVASGKLDLSMWLAIILCIVASIVPLGCTILFVILKLTHFFDASWWWIFLTFALDCIGIYAEDRSRR